MKRNPKRHAEPGTNATGLISAEMCARLNAQVGSEFGASQAYLAISCQFESMSLTALARLFRKQSDEERGHALKIVDYILDAGGRPVLPAVAKPVAEHASVQAAIDFAVQSELNVTRQINELVAQAEREKDYATRSFLQWFVDEQVEEVSSMSHLAQLARMAGDDLLQLEDRVRRLDEDEDDDD